MTVMELGALGEFLGVFALVATLIYLSIQVRHARDESETAVLEARTTGTRELSMGVATSDGLSAALAKAFESVGQTTPFETELTSRGLDTQEAHRVWRFFFSQWRLQLTQYMTTTGVQHSALDPALRAVYTTGVGRLFWDNFAVRTPIAFTDHVNQLIAEADEQQETLQ